MKWDWRIDMHARVDVVLGYQYHKPKVVEVQQLLWYFVCVCFCFLCVLILISILSATHSANSITFVSFYGLMGIFWIAFVALEQNCTVFTFKKLCGTVLLYNLCESIYIHCVFWACSCFIYVEYAYWNSVVVKINNIVYNANNQGGFKSLKYDTMF